MSTIDFILNQKKGVLIVYEGISGSGKSAGIAELLYFLNKNGHSPVVVEWNSNRFIRSLVSKLNRWGLLTSNVYSVLQWLSFLIDYCWVIRPALMRKKTVIADRYLYTGMTRDEVNGAATWIGYLLCRFVRKPDVVLFYNTPPQVCYERIRVRGKSLFHTNKSIWQREDRDLHYLQEIRNAYYRVFSFLKRHNMNLVFVDEESMNIHSFVAGYIDQKRGSYHYHVSNS